MKKSIVTLLSLVFVLIQQPIDAAVSAICPEDIYLGCNPKKIPKPKPNQVSYETDCRKAKVKHIGDFILEEGCEISIKRVYEVVDRCGDSDICIQYINYSISEEKPTLEECGQTIDLGCNADIEGNIPSINSLTPKGCGNVRMVLVTETRKRERCTIFLEQTIELKDDCGVSNICVVTYSWTSDTTSPVLVCEDLNLGCNPDTIPDPDPAEVKVEEECCINYVRHWKDESVVHIDCQPILHRYYIGEDCCGNRDTCRQIITWTEDVDPPMLINCIDTLDYGCNPDPQDIIITPGQLPFEIEESCGNVQVEEEILKETFDGCRYERTMNYLVTDQCGNSSSCEHVVTYCLDEVAPVLLSCPEDQFLGCAGPNGISLPLPDFGAIKYEDACEVSITVEEGNVTVTDNLARLVRGYFIEDKCGNVSICEQVFTWLIDNEPPTALCFNLYLGCNPEDFPDPDPSTIIANDNVGVASVEHLDDSDIIVFGCDYRFLRRYIITDECGNTAICTQSISWVVDFTPPEVIECPRDIDLGCNPDPRETIIDPSTFTVTGRDDCGNVNVTYEGSKLTNDGCQNIRTNTWILTDDCGNSSECQQEIKWINTEEEIEIINCAPALFLGCYPSDIPEPDFDLIKYSSPCDQALITYENNIDLLFTPEQVIFGRTYFLTDRCGNKDTCYQPIIWDRDVEPPVFEVCVEGEDLGCLSEKPSFPFDPNEYVVTDDCGIASLEHTDQEIAIDDCYYVFRRWVIATDISGKTTVCFADFNYSIVNEDYEEIPIPEDQTIFCGDVPAAPRYESNNACGIGVPTLFGEITIGDCNTNNCTVLRTWERKECNGEVSLQVQAINLTCSITDNNRSRINKRDNVSSLLFPNPGNEILNINTEAFENTRVEILNSNGAVLYQEIMRSKNLRVNMEEYPGGVYFVRIIRGKEAEVKKWFKVQ